MMKNKEPQTETAMENAFWKIIGDKIKSNIQMSKFYQQNTTILLWIFLFSQKDKKSSLRFHRNALD